MIQENINEKRSEGRLLTRLSSSIKLVPDDSAGSSECKLYECITRDISFGGICLLMKEELPISNNCLLKIEDRNTGSEYNHMCQITWCREKDEGYMVGLHIYESLCDISEWKNMVIGLLAG